MPSSLDSLSRLEDKNLNYKQLKATRREGQNKIKWQLLYYVPSLYIYQSQTLSQRLIAGKTGKVNYISLFGQLQVPLFSFSALKAQVLILVIIFAQIRESVFNFSKAVLVVNQSRRKVRQPAFLQ